MMKIALYGGIISFLGIDMKHGEITFNANDFHFRKLQLRASYAAPALWFPRALELLKSGIVNPKDFITQTFPLEKAEEYFKKQRDDISDVIKNGNGDKLKSQGKRDKRIVYVTEAAVKLSGKMTLRRLL